MENGNNRLSINGRSSLPTFVGGKSLSANKHVGIRRQPSFERHYGDSNQTNGAVHRSALPTPSSVGVSSSINNHDRSPSFRRSQLPRPGSSAQHERPDHVNVMGNGQYMSLHEAMRRSPFDHSESEESSARGSPSPAPREHLDGIRSREFKGHFSKIPLKLNRRPSSRHSTSSGGAIRDDDSQVSAGSSPDGRPPSRLRQPTQYNADKDRVTLGGGGGVFSKAKGGDLSGPESTGGSRELSRKASSSSLDGRRFGSWGVKGQLDPNFKRRLMSPDPIDPRNHDADVPIPSIEMVPATRSPEKSFAWGAEADFTAGELQVSDSPPIKVMPDTQLGVQNLKSFRPMVRSNTRIDEIKMLENELRVGNFENDEPGCPRKGEEIKTIEAEPLANKPLIIHRTNHKLEELRIKEMASLSKKSLAKERLDEIRRRNSASRSLSPEMYGKPSLDIDEEDFAGQPKDVQATRGDQGEAIPDTPVVVYRSDPHRSIGGGMTEIAVSRETEKEILNPKSTSHYRKDSHDLLKRLARAASSSPSQEKQAVLLGDNEQEQKKDKEPPRKNIIDDEKETAEPTAATTQESFSPTRQQSEDLTRKSEFPSDKVNDFAELDQLRKVVSTGSSVASSKRSSATFDSTDPALQIASEEKLFALRGDGQSERGESIPPSEPDPLNDTEETPRAKRQDPQTMTTPKAPGAYVETPATVRVQDVGVSHRFKGPSVEGTLVFKRPRSLVEIKARSSGDAAPAGHSSSVSAGNENGGTKRRRAKSLPRAQSPLINSVKLPSAKDDLLQIQMRMRSEDDTLDDFAEFLQDLRDTSNEEVALEQNEEQKFEKDQQSAATRKPKAEDEEGLDILGKSVHRALLEVQDSKKGIERLIKAAEASPGDTTSQKAILERLQALEQSQNNPASSSTRSATKLGKGGDPVAQGAKATSRRMSSWFWRCGGLSWLGKLLILVLGWACLEVAMCHVYCRPLSCSPGQDCSWAPSDPFPGYALPVKVDEWATTGRGRALFDRLSEEIGDLVDEAKEVVLGLVFGDAGADANGSDGHRKKDERFMSWEERRRYRRRLARRGLIKKWSPPAEYVDRFKAWGAARKEREYAAGMREMGYDRGDGLGGESMDDDERLS